MSEIKKVATRDSYGNALVELGKEHDDLIVLDADLAGATKTGMFKKAFPERHWDIGIAEANMTGIAAGVAACGKVPFISSFAMFAAGRAYEQVRNAIGYPHLNVKIGATHAGISVGEDGATHQCLEDIGLMREIPGMVVINPADDVEARAAVKAAYEHVGPVYLRFGRLAVPVFNDEATYKFEIGKGIVLKEGTDVTIFATGLCVNETIEAEKMLAADGINAEIINIHTIKPLDRELVVKSALKTGKVVTVEEHSVIGGLGSAVCDVLSEKAPTQVMKIGVNDTFGESGPALELLKKYGLDINHLYTHTHWLNVRDGKSGTVDYLNTTRNPYKMCPAYILPHWAEFKKKVQAYMNVGSSTPATSSPKQLYRVRKSWSDAKSQIGAFSSLENAKKACKVGYSVFDANGNVVYTNGSQFTKGQKVTIRANTPLFASAETTSVTRRISGTYYLYDGIACKNGRYRITTKPEFCGKTPVGQYVTGYVSWDNFGVIG